MFCNLSIIRFITIFESSRSLLSEYISRRVQAECFLTSFSQAKRVGVSRVESSVTEAVFNQVGGGRVSLLSTCCSEFYFVETTFILE